MTAKLRKNGGKRRNSTSPAYATPTAAVGPLASPCSTASLLSRYSPFLLGHILRRPYDHPDRLCIFGPNDELEPRTAPDIVRRTGRPRIVWTETIVPTIERLLNRTRTQIHHLAQNRQNGYEETERPCSLLRRELQLND